ncbi:hypothetical protein WP8W19C02_34000 [Enterobacter cloacae]|nr:hypothetical protein WP8W19C02_34000 [Enterobacter cloacae]
MVRSLSLEGEGWGEGEMHHLELLCQKPKTN